MALPPDAAAPKAEDFKHRMSEFGILLRKWAQTEWYGSPFHMISLRGRRIDGIAAAPRDLRPADAKRGKSIIDGVFTFADQTLSLGENADPFDRANPSQAFAEALHRMNWLRDLMAQGEAGEREALRLLLIWRRVFGGWNTFSWGARILVRRVINLACALRATTAHASDLERTRLAESLARQGRHLLKVSDGPAHAAERACAAAIAGTALGGPAGEKLMDVALSRLSATLPETVLADGGHASRSPQAGLTLMLDLLVLEDGLSQRGRPAPDEMSRALDRLSAALRVLAAPDGRLACFQGGEAGDPSHLAAAQQSSDLDLTEVKPSLPHAGYERMSGPSLTLIADCGAPAHGAWSDAACAQPAALEIYCGRDRLITNCGWSPLATGPQALRLTTAGSTLCVGEGSAGDLSRARIGGHAVARLKGGAREVTARRQETSGGVLIEIAHDGWEHSWGLRHERLLYLDRQSDELRGEDRLAPLGHGRSSRMAPAAIRFHLDPGVKASLARDRKSVLIQGPTTPGWWLRNDAQDVSIEHSVHFENGQPRRTVQVVLRSHIPAAEGGKIRWKLAAMTPGAGPA
jgi:uncharacterized heparinase superfamily protein